MAKSSGRQKRNGQEKRVRFSDDLLWGVHPVFEALQEKKGNFSEIIIQKDRQGAKVEDIIAMGRSRGIKISFVPSIRLTGDGASRVRHQGIIARTSETALLPLEEFLQRNPAKRENGTLNRLIVCDSLQDPHNLGAIVRSALASGAGGVIVTRERSVPLGGAVAKSSAGALSHIDVCQVTNLVTALKHLKKAGYWVFGAIKDDDASSLYETDLAVPACFVVGSEGRGIRTLVRKECDILLSIPMEGRLDSLNSSVAAAVILFEAMRQNRKS
jgi:23S rRNA (guanosine2251-2'-O)-methyltransferase